jgi:hypothetical protein
MFAQDFAAKLPTAPQLTVYASNLKDLEDQRPSKGFDKLSQNAVGFESAPWAKLSTAQHTSQKHVNPPQTRIKPSE